MFSLIFSLVVLLAAWYNLKFRRRNELLSRIPVISPTYPLIGSNLSVFGCSSKELLEICAKTSEELGPVWRFDMTPFESGTMVMVSDPSVLESLLSNSKLITKGSEYDFFKRWLGSGKQVELHFEDD